MKRVFLIAYGLFMTSILFAQQTDSLIARVFFESNLGLLDTSDVMFTHTYTPSGSFWEVDSFPESVVFQAELHSLYAADSTQSYRIRVGKGGHLYSFIGEAFGESVPPQWRPNGWVQPTYGGGTSYAPWVDEVWQLVCVDGALHNPPDSSYFIHQAGVYLKTPSQNQPFYSPTVAEYYDSDKKTYTTVNWGQQAHTEDLASAGFTSSLLYYTRYTLVGEGILQVDNIVYNFGQDNINFMNVPWGGVRNSSLEHFFISAPDHSYVNTPGLYGQTPVIQTATTAGWIAWASDSLGDSPALGLVNSIRTNTNSNVFRYGDAGNLSNPNNFRDYHVHEMIRFPAPGQLGFGRALNFRYFYVLAESIDSVRSKIIQEDLVGHTLDSAYVPMMGDVDSVQYKFMAMSGEAVSVESFASEGIMLRTMPFADSYPVFRLTASDGRQFVSSDPYHFSDVAYDGTTQSLELLGFRDAPAKIIALNDTICTGTDYVFPDGSSLTNVSSDQFQVSNLTAIETGFDSLVMTNLVVLSANDTLSGSNAPCIVFPVELLAFEGSIQEQSIVLSWVTATETNNKGFDIEWSVDGNVWERLGFVQGNGTSSHPNAYSYMHVHPPYGKHYYRLKQWDYDGSFQWSNVIELTLTDESSWGIVPSHNKGIFRLLHGTQGHYKIVDATGKHVYQGRVSSQQTQTQIDVQHLPNGIYMLHFTDGVLPQKAFKFVKQ